jgi:hypothetical protein
MKPVLYHIRKLAPLVICLAGPGLFGSADLVAQVCRTPGHTGYILFEPCAYSLGPDADECDSIYTRGEGFRDIGLPMVPLPRIRTR